MKRLPEITFRATCFPVVPHEDEEINPGVLGKSLSEWLVEALADTKFPITEEIVEDFGYCLMVHRKPYWLWVGCTGIPDVDFSETGLTEEVARDLPLESVEWIVWVATEMGLLNRWLRRDNRQEDARELREVLVRKLEGVGVEFV